MEPVNEYPEIRELDGIYFRVERDGKWENICWTDLTWEERYDVSKDRPISWWRELALEMTRLLRNIGDIYDMCNTSLTDEEICKILEEDLDYEEMDRLDQELYEEMSDNE